MSSENPMSESASVNPAPTGGTAENSGSSNIPADSGDATTNELSPSDNAGNEQASEGNSASEGDRPKRRVTLNPTVNPEQIKAIPAYTSTLRPRRDADAKPTSGEEPSSSGPDAQDSRDGNAVSDESYSAGSTSKSDLPSTVEIPVYIGTPNPVEIPREEIELGSEMEAEIEAAMASGMLSLPAVMPAAAAVDEAVSVTEDSIQPGARLSGIVQSVHGDGVFLDLGVRSPGLIASRQFEGKTLPEPGQKLDVIVDKVDTAEGLIHLSLPRAKRRPGGQWDSVAKGQLVDCLVAKTNKGGLEVTIGSLRGFLPASQIELGFVSDMESYIGQKLTVQITDVNPQKRNLVVSRRAQLLQERQEAGEKTWQELAVDQKRTGRVKTLKDYGAFIDLGGIDGFLHIGEMSWTRI